jgi:hypothetical protein
LSPLYISSVGSAKDIHHDVVDNASIAKAACCFEVAVPLISLFCSYWDATTTGAALYYTVNVVTNPSTICRIGISAAQADSKPAPVGHDTPCPSRSTSCSHALLYLQMILCRNVLEEVKVVCRCFCKRTVVLQMWSRRQRDYCALQSCHRLIVLIAIERRAGRLSVHRMLTLPMCPSPLFYATILHTFQVIRLTSYESFDANLLEPASFCSRSLSIIATWTSNANSNGL